MLPPNPSMSFFDNTLADNLGKVMHSEAEAMAVVAALGALFEPSDFPSGIRAAFSDLSVFARVNSTSTRVKG